MSDDDVDLQQKVEALEQYMSAVQKAFTIICERLDALETNILNERLKRFIKESE